MTHCDFSLTARACLGAVLTIALATAAHGIHPATWQQTTEADFASGEREGLVITNHGDVRLSRGADAIGELPDDVSVIYDIQTLADGSTYIAAGPEAVLLKLEGDRLVEVARVAKSQAFALDVYQGRLLVAISSMRSRLATLEDGELVELIDLVPPVEVDEADEGEANGEVAEADDVEADEDAEAAEPAAPQTVRYVWDMVVVGDVIYAATGIEGQLLRVEPGAAEDQRVAGVLDADQPNLLCLGRDGDGRLYAGTDADGLVYRITLGDEPTSFVIYDAQEPEIGALLVREDGTVYAGTADAEQAVPGRLEGAAEEESGRPEIDAGGEQPDDPGDLPVEGDPAPLDEEPAADAAEEAEADVPDDVADAAEGEVAIADMPQPTAEQRDELRAVIRDRLEQARKTGQLQAGRQQARRPGGGARARAGQGGNAATATSDEGNAVYRIAPDGFVTEVFRESVIILSIIDDGDRLLIATGNEGQVYHVDAAAQETSILADLEANQIPIAIATEDGQMMLGTANPAGVVILQRGFGAFGEYTSPVHDASQVSLWGRLNVMCDIPANTSIEIATRSSNVADPDHPTWSPWDVAATLEHDPDQPALAPRGVTLRSPSARFLQYRVTLLTDDAERTPVLDGVSIVYVVPNLRPAVTAVTAARGEPADDLAANPVVNIEWEAADPNGDALTFKLDYRAAGSSKWLPIARDLTDTRYQWDTRRVPDGRYVVRVEASDRADNPADMALTNARISGSVVVDNTRPRLVDGPRVAIDGDAVTLRFRAQDELSPITRVQYVVDAEEHWHVVAPVDLIYDSTAEAFVVIIADLSPGPHVVTLRVEDQAGNTRYEAVEVDID